MAVIVFHCYLTVTKIYSLLPYPIIQFSEGVSSLVLSPSLGMSNPYFSTVTFNQQYSYRHQKYIALHEQRVNHDANCNLVTTQ